MLTHIFIHKIPLYVLYLRLSVSCAFSISLLFYMSAQIEFGFSQNGLKALTLTSDTRSSRMCDEQNLQPRACKLRQGVWYRVVKW